MKRFIVFLFLLIPLISHSVVKVFEYTPIPEQYNQLQDMGYLITACDIDRDSKLDLIFWDFFQICHYEQAAIGILDFELISNTSLDLSGYHFSYFFYDIDNDNRFELLSSSGNNILVSSQSDPYSYTFYQDFAYAPFTHQEYPISSYFFACNDLNGDGITDVVAGHSSSGPSTPSLPDYVYLHLLSCGNNSLNLIEENFVNTSFDTASIPALTYYDHDEKIDLIVSSAGNLQYFEQETAGSFNFIPISSGFDGLYYGYSKPVFCDFNDDGIDDLIIYDAYAETNKIYLRKLWADWSYEQLSPTSYQFTNNSIGDYAVCQWYFDGDNVPDSEEENPIWEFEDEGEHEIHLVLRDGEYCDINTKYINIGTNSDNDQIPNIELELSNYPNPFNPVTTINYNLTADVEVELSIFNIKGQKIKTLVNEKQKMGSHSIVWDGEDDKNNSVRSGIYLYKLKADNIEMTKRMLLLK